MKFINKAIDKLPFELHIPTYKFCGPGTRLSKRLARGDKGINALDEHCKQHDISYAENRDLESRREADLRLSKAAGERLWARDSSLGERAAAVIVKTAMALKRKVGAGIKKRKRKTRVLVSPRFGAGKRRRRGGFVVPLAAALTAGIGAVKTFKDMRNAKKLVEEQRRHNRALEKIAKEQGLRLGAGNSKNKKRIGGKLRKKKKRGSCARKTIHFL